eukprot:1182902-Prymnesium_polylepis.1
MTVIIKTSTMSCSPFSPAACTAICDVMPPTTRADPLRPRSSLQPDSRRPRQASRCSQARPRRTESRARRPEAPGGGSDLPRPASRLPDA